LELVGSDSRIDHRSHAARGITTEPTTHQGAAAAAMEKRNAEPSRKRLIVEAYEYAVEVVADFIESFHERITARRSPFDVRPPERPLTPSPPWAKPPH
jgi:hypothetical protein